MAEAEEKNIQELTLEEIMGDRFGRYSKYIIQERALPDVRDGLKPVQRRILFAMNLDGNTYDKAFRKSAKSVGNVMGNFHPHGDSSIYEAMVHLSQDWKLREPLIEMHGNNGSMDGDSPAAMRYTEARLSKISQELLRDINKQTVDMVLNFDDTEEEPTVLPAAFPNLLVNGSTGISAGYATEIPTHNLTEVIDGAIYLLAHPDATLADLMAIIPGPDFPTGGIIQGVDGIKEAYETGRGRIMVRSKTQITALRGGREQIVISEIPYQVNKAVLVKKIDEVRVLKKVDGIAEVRDESDRFGLSVVVELKKNADAEGILNYLFKNTDLQVSYNFNMVAIADMQPKQLGLRPILQAYLDHRKDVVTRRTQFNLQKAQDRQHIVAGLIKMMSILDEVIHAIRASKDKADAKNQLVAQFDFSQKQAEAIVSLQLYRLTNTDITALEQELAELTKAIKGYQELLADPLILQAEIKQELQNIRQEYGPAHPRKTQIEDAIASLEIDTSVMVTNETVMVGVSHDGYLKRSSLRSFQASSTDNGLKEADYFVYQGPLQTLDHLMMFTDQGHLIYRPVHEIADSKWKDTGEHLSQTVGLEADESVIAAYGFSDLTIAGEFVQATNDGYIKRTTLADFKPSRTYKSRAMVSIKCHDTNSRVTNVAYLLSADVATTSVMAASYLGYGLRFSLAEVPTAGAHAAGVKLMALKTGDHVANIAIATQDDNKVVILTQRGALKKMLMSEVSITTRGRRGVLILRELKREPHRIQAMTSWSKGQELLVLTDKDQQIKLDPANYTNSERYSNGSFVIDTDNLGVPVTIFSQTQVEPIDSADN